MTWETIALGFFSGTTLLSVYEAIKYRRENKTIKKSEAAKEQVSAKEAEIDLASKYRDEMLSMVDMVKAANDKNFMNQDQIMEKLMAMGNRLDRMDERLEKLEINYNNLEEWANGSFHSFLANKEKTQRNKKTSSKKHAEKKPVTKKPVKKKTKKAE